MFDESQLTEALFVKPSNEEKQGKFVSIATEEAQAGCSGNCESGFCRG
ncbi:hypothetical protein KFE69_00170 [bacterium SCSIO 12844]|nr:hypothetical protein KFE69_00170 [bacterium SCSIO 12844]